MAEVNGGDVDLMDILKINALMDAQEAAQAQARRQQESR